MSENGREIFLLIYSIRKHFCLSATIYMAGMFKLEKSHRSHNTVVLFSSSVPCGELYLQQNW